MISDHTRAGFEIASCTAGLLLVSCLDKMMKNLNTFWFYRTNETWKIYQRFYPNAWLVEEVVWKCCRRRLICKKHLILTMSLWELFNSLSLNCFRMEIILFFFNALWTRVLSCELANRKMDLIIMLKFWSRLDGFLPCKDRQEQQTRLTVAWVELLIRALACCSACV